MHVCMYVCMFVYIYTQINIRHEKGYEPTDLADECPGIELAGRVSGSRAKWISCLRLFRV